MAKEKNLKLDKFDLDNDLDFPDFDGDLDGQFSTESKATKKRTVVGDVFSGTVSGVKSKLTDPGFLAQTVKKSLPSTYGKTFEAVDTMSGSLSQLYDETIREIKPQAARLAKKIDKLVPDDSSLKKLTSRVKEMLGDETRIASAGKEEMQDQSIATAMSGVFGDQMAVENAREERRNASDKLRDAVDHKKFQTNFGVISSINDSVTRIASYTEKVNQAYQKKSLELQYRSFFAMKELLDLSTRSFEVTKAQNEAIVKNTALPEFVKLKESERFKELAKNKFYGGLQTKLLGGAQQFIERGMRNMRDEVKNFMDGIKMGLEGAESIAEAVADMDEQSKQMEEFGGEGMSKANLGGQMLGGKIGDFAQDKVVSKVKPWLAKHKGIAKFGNSAYTAVTNPEGAMEQARNSKLISENYNDVGIKGSAVRGLDYLMSMFTAGGPDMTIGKKDGANNLKDPEHMFNGKTQRSITEIIPGYLARILREVTSARTGNNESIMEYDYSSSKFMPTKELGEVITSRLDKKVKSFRSEDSLDEAAKAFKGDALTTVDETKTIKMFLSKIAILPRMQYTYEYITQLRDYKDLNPTDKQLIGSLLQRTMDDSNGENQDGADKAKFAGKMADFKSNYADIRGDLEMLIENGYGDILESKGLAKRNEEGQHDIDAKGTHKFIRGSSITDGSVVTSDIHAKKNISILNPKGALDAVRKSKVYNWMYKKGKGDGGVHNGPMAQDVNKTMGEEAAPDGTSIDLTTMNGNNMAAIQELADKQEAMVEGGKSASILDLIRKDTGTMVELMQKGGTGNGGGTYGLNPDPKDKSYQGLMTTLVASTASLVSRVGGDLFTSAGKVLTFGKDKLAKPLADALGKVYSDNKDAAGSAVKDMFGKAMEFGSKALSFSGDVLFNKLPKGFAGVMKAGQWVGKKFTELLNGARDVYVAGINSPVIQASLLKAGYYKDQATDKVISNMDDLKNATGDIIDGTGNIVLSIQQRASGLYDKYGKEIKSTAVRIAGIAGAAVSGFAKKAIGGLKKAGDILGGLGKGMSGKMSDMFSKADIGSFGFGNDKIYNVLVEMRDIMLGKNPEPHEGSGEPEGEFVGPMPQSKAGKLKDKALGWLGKQKEGFQKGMGNEFVGPKQESSKVAGTLTSIKDLLKKSLAKQESEQTLMPGGPEPVAEQEPKEATPEMAAAPAKYGSATNVIDGITSAAGKVAGRVSGAFSAMKEGKGLKGKLAAGFGGLMKGGSATEDEKPKEDKPEEKPEVKPETPVETAPLNAGKPKSIIKSFIARGAKLFNDKDGNGKRDGNTDEREAELEKRNSSRKVNKGMAAAAASYQSRENIVDTIMKKASGIFDTLKSGAGSLLETAGALSGGGGVKGLMSGAWGLLKKAPGVIVRGGIGAVKGVGAGLAAVGGLASKLPGLGGGIVRGLGMVRNIATIGSLATGGAASAAMGVVSATAGAIGAVLSSPVMLGAIAVAATGYLLYKGYKYATRNSVSKYDAIRIKQYGLGYNEDVAKYNNKIMKLEEYLIDGKVGYNSGQAYINGRKVEDKEIRGIFDIDEKDTAAIDKLQTWMQDRFKPFFLTHLTALAAISTKVNIFEVDKLTKEQQLKYLNTISFESGPYDVSTSPISDIDSLSTDKPSILAFIENAIKELKSKVVSNKKESIEPKKAVENPEDKAKIEVPPPKPVLPPKKLSLDNKPADPLAGDDSPTAPKGNATSKELGAGTAAAVKQAGGVISSGEAGMQYIKLAPGVSLDTMNPDLLRNLKAMAQEYGEKTGRSLNVTSGSRTSAQQAALYAKNPKKAAKPGNSLHEFGLAIDVDSKDLDSADSIGLMRKYGFTRPVGGEGWHMEPAGIQVNLDKARKDSNFAGEAIKNSLFKGGGGYGSVSGSALGRRNSEMALALLGTGASVSKVEEPKAKENILAPSPETTLTAAVKAPEVKTATAPVKEYTPPPLPGRQKADFSANLASGDSKSASNGITDAEKKPKEAANDASGGDGDIKSRIASLAKKAGTDPNMMQAFAAVESSLNPNAKASGSSAQGLYGFTNATWKEQLTKHGKRYDIADGTSSTDVTASTLMASEYVKTNSKFIQSVKSNPNITDIYLTHFLGPSGARQFLSADPSAIAATILPKAAASNKSIFYDGQRALTIGEVYGNLSKKLEKVAKSFGINIGSPGTMSASPKAAAVSMPAPNTDPVSASNAPVSTSDPLGSNETLISGSKSGSSPDRAGSASSASSRGNYDGAVMGAQAPTLISPSGKGDTGKSIESGISSLANMNTTLSQSLVVQQNILAILEKISGNASSYKKGSEEAKVDSPATQEQARPAERARVVNSAVDLRRKMV